MQGAEGASSLPVFPPHSKWAHPTFFHFKHPQSIISIPLASHHHCHISCSWHHYEWLQKSISNVCPNNVPFVLHFAGLQHVMITFTWLFITSWTLVSHSSCMHPSLQSCGCIVAHMILQAWHLSSVEWASLLHLLFWGWVCFFFAVFTPHSIWCCSSTWLLLECLRHTPWIAIFVRFEFQCHLPLSCIERRCSIIFF